MSVFLIRDVPVTASSKDEAIAAYFLRPGCPVCSALNDADVKEAVKDTFDSVAKLLLQFVKKGYSGILQMVDDDLYEYDVPDMETALKSSLIKALAGRKKLKDLSEKSLMELVVGSLKDMYLVLSSPSNQYIAKVNSLFTDMKLFPKKENFPQRLYRINAKSIRPQYYETLQGFEKFMKLLSLI